MTGFGAAEGRVGNARVFVELRTVNHRFFNPSIKLPSALARWEGDVREALRQRIARGHVSVGVRAERDPVAAPLVNEARFAACVEQLRALQQRYGLGGDVDLATVLRMPEVFSAPSTDGAEDDQRQSPAAGAELVAIVDAAAQALGAMRAQEGKRLAGYLLERVRLVEDALGRIGLRAPTRLVEQRDRLRLAVRELLDGVAIDEQRLAQEIAILADRLDVAEELDRFRSHIEAFRRLLEGDAGAEPVGKRLGFILQEMLREANTTGSKANDAAMLADVVAIKEELERIREQVENLE
ncbi:MAG TPA: YicC/YloC family endoribonuclease [Gemmatimonadaceae bacterium]|nr:YicC/YloC family endoribonuclease [Gemmatimonadaceae bacterium]